MFRHLFPLLLLTACSGSRKATVDRDDTYIQVLQATAESWYTANREGDNGTDYRFTTLIRSGEVLQFDSVWIRSRGLKLPLAVGRTRGAVSNTPVQPAQGDTVLLIASFVNAAPKGLPAAAPAAFEGEALLFFRAGEKKIQKAVPAIQLQEGPPRPH